MERLIITVGRLYKSVAPIKYFFKVPLVSRYMPLVGVIRRPVESQLHGRFDVTSNRNSGEMSMILIVEEMSATVGKMSATVGKLNML